MIPLVVRRNTCFLERFRSGSILGKGKEFYDRRKGFLTASELVNEELDVR